MCFEESLLLALSRNGDHVVAELGKHVYGEAAHAVPGGGGRAKPEAGRKSHPFSPSCNRGRGRAFREWAFMSPTLARAAGRRKYGQAVSI